jgi:hypothetical protein
MKRFEENKLQEEYLEKVFSYLRGKNQGDKIQVKDKRTDQIREVCFIRRGRVNVSVHDLESDQTGLIGLEQVVIPGES